MAQIEDFQRRLEDAEATLQAMFCTVTADLVMFQAAIAALHEEGVLTERMIDRMVINAQLRLKESDSPALTPAVVSEIAAQLDNLAERLRSGIPMLGAGMPIRPAATRVSLTRGTAKSAP
jgi:hypothetical protein